MKQLVNGAAVAATVFYVCLAGPGFALAQDVPAGFVDELTTGARRPPG
jgi:hypothetical protein